MGFSWGHPPALLLGEGLLGEGLLPFFRLLAEAVIYCASVLWQVLCRRLAVLSYLSSNKQWLDILSVLNTGAEAG